MTSEIFTINEIIGDKLSGDNLSNEEEYYEEDILPSFKKTKWAPQKNFWSYFCFFNTSEKIFNELIENAYLILIDN